MAKERQKPPPLESGLLTALRAIDTQIAREMARSPDELEEKGVQKWEPFQTRIERVTAFLLGALGDDQIKLDSLIVMAQAMTKALALVSDELGEEALGELRSAYVADAFDKIAEDVRRGSRHLRNETTLM